MNLLALLAMLAIPFVLSAVVLGIGLGLGRALHWLVPEIDLGSATVAGVIAFVAGAYYFARLYAVISDEPPGDLERFPEEEEEDDDDVVVLLRPPRPPRRRRKRRS